MSFLGLKGIAWAWPVMLGFCLILWFIDWSYNKKHGDLARTRALKKVARETGLTEEEVEAHIFNLKKNRTRTKIIKGLKVLSVLLFTIFSAILGWQLISA